MLRDNSSEPKKRQEIGRGLRLCVNQEGARVPGDDVNILTVVANESYQGYVQRLQTEYSADERQAPPPSDASKAPARRNDDIYGHTEFRRLWTNLSKPVTPQFNLDTDVLITECANRLNAHTFSLPTIVVEQGSYVSTRFRLHLVGVGGSGLAKLRIEKQTTDGEEDDRTFTIKQNVDLEKTFDSRLRGFRVKAIQGTGDDLQIIFGNDVVLTQHDHYEFMSEAGQKPSTRTTMAPRETYPVANLLERAARDTGLTRPTLNRIFKAIHPDKAVFLLKNPESFIGAFIGEVSNALADHITERIQFGPGGNGQKGFDLETMFPAQKQFTQRELRPAGEHGLYDQVQTDSDNECSFVEIVRDDTKLIFYFKFPPTYKVPLPKQIGNYNPDWGLARLNNAGLALLYVRETKGSENIEDLQWAHEKRKIKCAEKYFAAMGVDYRPVKGTNAEWWKRPILTAELDGAAQG